MKKLLLFLLFLFLAGGSAYFFLKNSNNTGEQQTFSFKNFFPTGLSRDTENPQNQTDTPIITPTPNNQTSSRPESVFTQLTNYPIAGYTLYSTNAAESQNQAAKDYFVRYVSRTNGFVYEIKNNTPPLQISNILIQNIYEASFLESNTVALLRFIREDGKSIGSYLVPIPESGEDGKRIQRNGTFLENNILNTAISDTGKEAVILTSKKGDGTINIINSTGKQLREVFSYPFREWLLQWNNNNIYLQTKAAGGIPGYLFKISSIKSGTYTKILGGIPGMTTLVSPSGNWVFYSESIGNTFTGRIYNLKTRNTMTVNLPLLAEKCGWTMAEELFCGAPSTVPSFVYPDAWYSGLVSFQDRLVRISPNENTYEVLKETLYDITHIQTFKEKRELYFIDKKSGLLFKSAI